MQSAKIHLSPQQIKLVTDTSWILTKNEIIQCIKLAFGVLYEQQLSVLKEADLHEEILKIGGKISHGENYLGLPWIVLDYPRLFVRNNIFAIRTMFWWGKFFSTTLHMSGKWQQNIAPKLQASWSILQKNNFWISYTGNQWIHDITDTSYIAAQHITLNELETILQQAPFVKIGAYTAIENIDAASAILMQYYSLLIKIIGSE